MIHILRYFEKEMVWCIYLFHFFNNLDSHVFLRCDKLLNMITEDIRICTIIRLDQEKMVVRTNDGQTFSCFFEDLPFYLNSKSFQLGESIKMSFKQGSLIPIYSRQRQQSSAMEQAQSRKEQKKALLASLSYQPVRDALDQQIKQEIKDHEQRRRK